VGEGDETVQPQNQLGDGWLEGLLFVGSGSGSTELQVCCALLTVGGDGLDRIELLARRANGLDAKVPSGRRGTSSLAIESLAEGSVEPVNNFSSAVGHQQKERGREAVTSTATDCVPPLAHTRF